MLAVFAVAVLALGGYRVYRHLYPPAPPGPGLIMEETASASAAMKSASGTFTTQVSGLTVMFGTVRERVTPTRLATLTMTTVDGAVRFPVTEVVTRSSLYVSTPSMTASIGKPWLAVPVQQLGADPTMMQLYQTAALPTAQGALIGTAGTVRLAGTSFLRGQLVSRYVGSIDPATALAGLDPQLHDLLAPELTATTGAIGFTVWVDAQHNLRKVETRATISGQLTVTTVDVTAVNRKMHINVPPSADVAALSA